MVGRNPNDEANRNGGDFIKDDGAGVFCLKNFFSNAAEPNGKRQAEDGS